MKDKIVFFDIDGTLLTKEKVIPESTKKAVKMLQKRGIYTAIATGRSPHMFEWVLRELNIDSYVSINGQYVVFEGREVYSNPIEHKTLMGLLHMAESKGHAIGYCSDQMIKVNEENNPLIFSSYDAALKLDYPPVDRDFYKKSSIYQCHLFCHSQEEALYLNHFPECKFVRWHENALDILPKQSSKAVGIQKLLDVVGIDNRNCYAFGDGLNDLEMLSYVGTGIAMGNADSKVKAVADFITSSSYDDGIYNGLIELGLLEKQA